ncbi:hypothetical protein IOCL1545_000038100, partial [Leishmania shawi]
VHRVVRSCSGHALRQCADSVILAQSPPQTPPHLSGHRTAAPIVLVATRCIPKGGAGAPHQWPPGVG